MRILQIHSSDDVYGSDRIAVRVSEVLFEVPGAELFIWLPIDTHIGDGAISGYVADVEAIELRSAPIPVVRRALLTPSGLLGLAFSLGRFWRRLLTMNIDLIYATTSACFLVLPIAALCGVKNRIAHVQEIATGWERIALGILGFWASRIICISSPVQDSLPRILRRRSTVIVNCCDDPGVPDSRLEVLEEAESDTIKYLIASRWNSWKGHRTLLEAWKKSKQDNAVLQVLGGPPDTGEVFDVASYVEDDERLFRTVEIVGEVRGIVEHIGKCDVMVVPSDKPEPFGLVAIEAFAQGVPVIASDGGGLADIVTHGVTGWKFSPGSVCQLSALLSTITVAEAHAAGKNARRAYERNYTPERFRAEVTSVIQQVIGR